MVPLDTLLQPPELRQVFDRHAHGSQLGGDSLEAPRERLLGYTQRILALQHEARTTLGDPTGTTSIRLGLPEDISGPMAVLFRDFAREHREIRLDVTAGLSRQLTRRYRGGEFDIAAVEESAPSADCRVSFPEPMSWSEGLDVCDD